MALTLDAPLNCWVWLIPGFVSLVAELQPSPLSCLPWKRKIIPWICSCLPGDYLVLGCGLAEGFLSYLELKDILVPCWQVLPPNASWPVEDTAIASLVAFAMGQGLTCKIRMFLLKQCLAVSGEGHKGSVLRAVPVGIHPVLSSGDVAFSVAMRYLMCQLLAAVGKKG